MKMRKSIGIITPFFADSKPSEIIRTINLQAIKYGYNVVNIPRFINQKDMPLSVDLLDGYIVLYSSASESLMLRLSSLNKPVVSIGHDITNISEPVNIDNSGGMHEIVEHLIDHGHTKIVFVGALRSSGIQSRLEGYKQALQEHGIPYDPRYVVDLKNFAMEPENLGEIIDLCEKHNCTAVASSTDVFAVNIVKHLKEKGYSVPEDIAVTGYDNSTWAQSFNPGITSMEYNADLIGNQALDMLIQKIENRATKDNLNLPIKSNMTKRASCGCVEVESDLPNMDFYISKDEYAERMHQVSVIIQSISNASYDTLIDIPRFLLKYVSAACVGFNDRYNQSESIKLKVASYVYYEDGRRTKKPVNDCFALEVFPPVDFYTTDSGEDQAAIVIALPVYINNQLINVVAMNCNIDQISDPAGFQVLFHGLDIIALSLESKTLNVELRYMAYHDYLTKLPNRMQMYETMESMIMKGTMNSFAVMMLDLDFFKEINDAYGHHVGDQLLMDFVEVVKSTIVEDVQLFRYGGDEFVLIAPYTTDEHITGLAESIMNVFSEQSVSSGDISIQISFSAGVSVFPRDGQDHDTLIQKADLATYNSKQKGRSRLNFYTDAIMDEMLKKNQLVHRLRNALDCDEFKLVYQPLIDVRTGKVWGVETLIRWVSSEGLVRPDQFIPLAEENGLIISIGDWIIDTACKQKRAWDEMGYDELTMTVNISNHQIGHKGFAEMIKNYLIQYKINPAKFCIEITETAATDDLEATVDILKELRDFGVVIALDDFGTGYSSLEVLNRFPLHIVKIDRAFIRELHEGSRKEGMLKSIMMMAKTLGLKTIVEGIEEVLQYEMVKGFDCDIVQGYYFGKPVPPEEIDALLER